MKRKTKIKRIKKLYYLATKNKVYVSKDYYDKKDEWFSLLSKYENSSNKLLKRWADYEKGRIEQICKDHENDMAEMLRHE